MGLAIVKDRLWEPLRYRPHEGQIRVHKSPARHRVNAAGRRFGKSQVGGHELVPEAFRAHMNARMLDDLGIRMEFWIVGPNYTDAEKEFRVFYNDCKRLKLPFDRPGTYNDSRSGNMAVSMWDGKFILQAKSGAHPESLVGEGLHGVIMAEAAKMKESVWSKYVRPTLADFKGWSLWSSTPEGKNYFHDMWALGQDPNSPDWDSWRSPSWMNPYVFRGGVTDQQLAILKHPEGGAGKAVAAGMDSEIAAMYTELGDVLFGQEVECSFTEYAGRVYYDFDEETHVKTLEYNPSRPLYIATDSGYTNPNVALFLQTDVWDNVYVLGEYYRTHRTDDEFACDVWDDPRLGAYARVAKALYPDPANPGGNNVLANKWKVRVMGGTGGEIKDRVNLIRRHLKVQNKHLPFGHIDRQPRILWDRSCKESIREMDAYRYPDANTNRTGGNQENPMKKDDHSPEALSRFFAAYFGTQRPGGGVRISKARVSA